MSKYTKEELALYKVAVGDAKEGTADEIIQSCEEEAEFKRKVHEVIDPIVQERLRNTSVDLIERVRTIFRYGRDVSCTLSLGEIHRIAMGVKDVTKDTTFKAFMCVMVLINSVMLIVALEELQTVRKYMVNVAQSR